jgi:hypothetical protein
MKTKVKSWVQQERNMSGFKGKFPAAQAPEINGPSQPKEPYQPKMPTPDASGHDSNPFAKQLASGDKAGAVHTSTPR